MWIEWGPRPNDPHAKRIRELMRHDPVYRAQVLKGYRNKHQIRHQLQWGGIAVAVVALLVVVLWRRSGSRYSRRPPN